MKKIILFILLLADIPFLTETHASTKQQARDSIFQTAATIPNDSIRCIFLRNAFQQYIGQESATEYLDSAIVLARRKQIHGEELWALFDYCRQYEYLADIFNQQKRLLILKEASYQYKDYAFYYTMWLSVLQARCALGDTEYAIMQAQEMRDESTRLNYKKGNFIAALALAQAYDFAGRYDEAIEIYKQALENNPTANENGLLIIHGNLAKLYKKQEKYPQALSEYQKQLDVLTKVSKGLPLSDTFKTIFLEIETSFCKIYMITKDQEKLIQHLKKAEEYYSDNVYLGAYINYHSLWGFYYKLTKEWDKCFRELDLALAACRGTDPFNENDLLKSKADVLLETGRYKDAANLYKMVAIKGDSLNQDMLQRHKEAHQANYKIRRALLEKEELTKRYRYIQVGTGTIILLILVFVIIRAYHIRCQLRHAEKETRKAFERMEAADKMKERFLHNITYEIRIPLNTVVGFSELLSSENDLTDEEIEEYSIAVKSNSTKLLKLINNILDLSRLEAGMMRFTVQECDAVQLCRETRMIVDMETPGIVKSTFNTELEMLQIKADSKWFLKLLTSLLSVPQEYKGEKREVEYTLSQEDKYLKIIILRSPLYQCWEDEQEQHILHNLNRLYVETFKGSYQVEEKGEEKIVSITYPIS